MFASLVFLTLLLCGFLNCQTETGIELLNGEDCSDILTYLCTTTGLGEALLNISGILFRFRHAEYDNSTIGPNQLLNDDALDGLLMAGNLLESDDKTCSDQVRNLSDFCYTATLTAHVTDRTRCLRFACGVLGDNDPDETLIGRKFPPPSELIVDRSMNSTTVSWTSVPPGCTIITYQVMTDCGECPPIFNTTSTNITCENVAPDQECSVSVQSIQECGGYSASRMTTVQRFAAPASNSNALAIGLGLGISALVVLCVVVVIVVYRYNKCVRKWITDKRKFTESGIASRPNPDEDVDKKEEIPLDELESMSKTLDPNTSQLRLLDHDGNVTAEDGLKKLDPIEEISAETAASGSASSKPTQASPVTPDATGDSVADPDTPQLQEQAEESFKKLDLKEEDGNKADVSGSPPSQQAQTSQKEPEAATEKSPTDPAGASQVAEQAQASPKKTEVVEGSTAAVSGTSQVPEQAQSGGKSGEVVLHARPRTKSSGSYYEMRDKTPPRPQVSQSRGMPDIPGMPGVYHSFNTSEKSEREPNEGLVKHSESDIYEKSNRMPLNMQSIQELDLSGGVSIQPAAKGHSGSPDKDKAPPKSPIPQSDNGAGGSRPVAFVPFTEPTNLKVAMSSAENGLTLELLQRVTTNEQRVTANENAIRELRAESDAAKRERDKAKGERDAAKEERDVAKKERDVAKEERTKLLKVIDRLNEELSDMQTKYKKLEDKYKAEKSSHQELKNRHASLEKAEAKHKESTLERNKLRKANKDMRQEKEDWEKEKEKMQKEMDEIKRENENMKSKLQEAERRLLSTENEKRELGIAMKRTEEELTKAIARLQVIDGSYKEPESGN